MSRTRRSSAYWDVRSGAEGSSGNDRLDQGKNFLNHEIVQLTKTLSAPHKRFSRELPGRVALPVSPVNMLRGRECNYSGRGRFSAGDCCHLLSRYMPVYGPSLIDRMPSGAYVSQFSEDGSLFVAAFQV